MQKQTSDFALNRYRALWRAYIQALENPDVHGHLDAIKKAIESPATRYWISVDEASRQISRILRGEKPTYSEGGSKWKIIWKVYEEYKRLAGKRTFQGCSVKFVTSFAILSPAPQQFISFDRARRIIDKIRAGKYNGII